ncbi:MAG: hypothetical protein H0Z34_08265 [Brevibacillus sp.]|nr:hypothetical protein [Brevibacillus sp.]
MSDRRGPSADRFAAGSRASLGGGGHFPCLTPWPTTGGAEPSAPHPRSGRAQKAALLRRFVRVAPVCPRFGIAPLGWLAKSFIWKMAALLSEHAL